MKTIETDTQQLLEELEMVTSSLVNKINAVPEKHINMKPNTGRWSISQVADHVTKSNNSIAKALLLNGKYTARKQDERVPELQKVFLNFESKLKSPEFIVPADDFFSKNTLIATLQHSTSKLLQISAKQDLSVMINHPSFGDITKFEIIYFVIFHTQRHSYQIENISRALTIK